MLACQTSISKNAFLTQAQSSEVKTFSNLEHESQQALCKEKLFRNLTKPNKANLHFRFTPASDKVVSYESDASSSVIQCPAKW